MSGLRERAIRGVAWTAAQRWTVRATSLLTFITLSRLLQPADIGLVALALAVTGTLSVFVDLGLSDYLVRSDDDDPHTLSTIFWVQTGSSIGLAVVVALAARPLAVLLDMPRLAPVLQVSGALLPLFACAVVPTALMHRKLAFRSLALRDVAATVTGAIAGVGAATLGAGVWALVIQSAVSGAASLGTVLAVTRWRPTATFSPAVVRRARRFVGAMTGVQILQALRDRADHLLVGSLLGPQALGQWLVAARLVGIVSEMSASTLDTVALPVFSRVQKDPFEFQRVHAVASSYAALLLVPGLLVLGFASPVLVPALFGQQWIPAALLAQILCLSYAIFGLTYLNRPTLIAHGRIGVEFALTAVGVGTHIALVTVASIGGLTTVAWAMVAEAVLLVLIGSLAVRRALQLTPPIPWSTVQLVAGGLIAATIGGTVQYLTRTGGQVTAAVFATLSALVVFGAWTLITDVSLVRDAGRDARRLLAARE